MVVSSTLSECFQGHYFPIIHWTSCLLPYCLCQQHQNTITYTSNTIGVPESLPLHQVGHRRESGRLERAGLTQQSDEPLLCVLHFFIALLPSFLCFLRPVVGRDGLFCFSILYITSFIQESILDWSRISLSHFHIILFFFWGRLWLALFELRLYALSSDVSWRTEVLKTVLVEEEGSQKDCSRLTARSECPQLPCSQFWEHYLVTLTSGVPINGILGRFPTMSCHHLGRAVHFGSAVCRVCLQGALQFPL